MADVVPRKRGKLSLAKAKKAELSVYEEESGDVTIPTASKTRTVIEEELPHESQKESEVFRLHSQTPPDLRRGTDIFLRGRKTSCQPYRPLPPMKLKIQGPTGNEEVTRVKNISKENVYKPLPRRVIKLWKCHPEKLEHNLLVDLECHNALRTNDKVQNMEMETEESIAPVGYSNDDGKSTLQEKDTRNNDDNRDTKVKIGRKRNITDTFGDSSRNVNRKSRNSGSVANKQTSEVGPQKTSENLNCCPLCQLSFTGGISQMDQDSHIAACLALSADDVIW